MRDTSPTGRIESALVARLTRATRDAPPNLGAAMRYAVLGGGARLRPLLSLSVARVCGDPIPRLSDAAACAVELIHAASLVHDDLPCLDDAAIRRSKPSVHRRFGVPTALLAGDALIVLAFEVIADETEFAPERIGALIGTLARGCGGRRGIAAGQAAELENDELSLSLRLRKTSALFESASALGALAAGADPKPWLEVGRLIGEAFQVADDVRDVVANVDEIGKPTRRDQALGRPNAALTLGVDAARARVAALRREALAAIPLPTLNSDLIDFFSACGNV